MPPPFDTEPGGWDAWLSSDGSIRIQTPDGNIIRLRGKVVGKPGRDGKDGYTPVKGKDYFDGKDGESIQGPPGKDGRDGKSVVGPAGKNGVDGKSVVGPKGDKGEAGLSVEGPRGLTGLAGKDGEIGPIPRHELDPEETPHRIRFELERNMETGKTTKWGEWIDLRKLLPKVMPRGGGAGLNKWDVLKLIQENPSSQQNDGYDRVEVAFVSSTDERPSRVVRTVGSDSTEDRFDWGTGTAGTYQYKGTAPAGTSTASPLWTVFRSTLDSLARPGLRERRENISWDLRSTGW